MNTVLFRPESRSTRDGWLYGDEETNTTPSDLRDVALELGRQQFTKMVISYEGGTAIETRDTDVYAALTGASTEWSWHNPKETAVLRFFPSAEAE